MSRILLLALVALCLGYALGNPCRSADASKSCGQCIKAHPDCAWCTDPNMKGSFRCDKKSEFNFNTCPAESVYQPKAETLVAEQNNFHIDQPHPQDNAPVQMHPQQVIIRMKPGDVVEVPFRYKHKSNPSVHEFAIQTSEFKSLGIDVQFSVLCNGKKIEGRNCHVVREGEITEFYAKVILNECRQGGDIPVSIGIFGYNKISASLSLLSVDVSAKNSTFINPSRHRVTAAET
ncbi:hypothetical protein L596_020670 [Steinernema carpocapsae]|uniref:Integrin beta N-terminal domain-containing protein n=1 Tax=Steinernema carpocapsae TaxID=34508 RepID=A0A4U5MV03_STECR|nr:hypothetical protein L596_020670 [Steinernema carpocapsae]